MRSKKKTNDIKLVFYSSTITMMNGPINIRFIKSFYLKKNTHLSESDLLISHISQLQIRGNFITIQDTKLYKAVEV